MLVQTHTLDKGLVPAMVSHQQDPPHKASSISLKEGQEGRVQNMLAQKYEKEANMEEEEEDGATKRTLQIETIAQFYLTTVLDSLLKLLEL